MAEVRVTGLEQNSPFSKWVERIIDHDLYGDMLDDLGNLSVKRSVSKLQENKVKPQTSKATLNARRKGGAGGKTLVDTGVGARSITHNVEGDTLHVGIPENKEGSYMAYHQMGWGVKRRQFLTLPTKAMIKKTIREYWESTR